MTEVTTVSAAAEAIRAAYYPLYQRRILDFPESLRDDLHALSFPRAIQSQEMALAQMSKWVLSGWKLYKAASLGIQPPATRFKNLGPAESRAVIEPDDLCHLVQRAFRETVAPPAKQVPVLTGLPKDLRDYLAR